MLSSTPSGRCETHSLFCPGDGQNRLAFYDYYSFFPLFVFAGARGDTLAASLLSSALLCSSPPSRGGGGAEIHLDKPSRERVAMREPLFTVAES